MNETGKFRKKHGFTMAPNTLVRDKVVSHKAKGLYLLISSYITMENLTLTKSFLLSKSSEGEKAFNSNWDELKEKGYLKMYMKPSKQGWQVEYDLLDEPRIGAHTFYLSADGTVTSSNLTRAEGKRSAENQKKRYPPFGSNANGTNADGNNGQGYNVDGLHANSGNNIILPYNTLYNTPNNQSINQEQYADRVSEDELKEDVDIELASGNGIPYSYKADERKMAIAIRVLTGWYELTVAHFSSDFEKDTFDLLVDCLIEMACTDDMQKYKGCCVSYTKVIDKINECVRKDSDLSYFKDETIDDYIQAASDREIKDKSKYMKSVIWNSLCTYKVKFESHFARTY